jgi:TolA-binding protein
LNAAELILNHFLRYLNSIKNSIMSATNYPSATPQTPAPKKDNRGLIYGVLIAALLGTWGYIIYDKSKTKEVIQQKDVQYSALDSSKNMIQKEYEDALLRLDAMTGTNSKLDSLVKSRDKEIGDMKGRIQSLVRKQNASAADLTEARELIKQLNGKIDDYVKEIERLTGENKQLTADKEQLTTQKAELQTNLATTDAAKKAAEEKVDIGSTLHASNFKIQAINEKGGGKEKATTTAKRADKFRISFDLDENMISPSGTKDLYVIVIDPAGKVISEQGLNSGSFTTRKDGEKQFTNKVSVEYAQGERKNVSFDLKQTDKYQPGNYKVEVYNNGFKIGENTVSLKKGGLFS